MQNVDLRNKNYKQFLVKNESEAAKKKFIFDFFFHLNFDSVFFLTRFKSHTYFTRKNCKV